MVYSGHFKFEHNFQINIHFHTIYVTINTYGRTISIVGIHIHCRPLTSHASNSGGNLFSKSQHHWAGELCLATLTSNSVWSIRIPASWDFIIRYIVGFMNTTHQLSNVILVWPLIMTISIVDLVGKKKSFPKLIGF